MSMFRKTRMSNEQLQSILRSLPQAKASADFEENLDKMIASNSHHVPNLLGSLPLVPAPDDFDARLMEAIRDRRRPVAPIPIAVAAGGASINWINHIMGWIGGSLAVVALAFVINHATEIVPESAQAPAAAPRANGVVATAPAAATAPSAPKAAAPAASVVSESREVTVAQAEQPAPIVPGTLHTRLQDATPSAASERSSTSTINATPSHRVDVSTPAAASTTTTEAPAQHDQRNPASEPAVVNTPGDVATGPSKTDTNAVSSEKDEMVPQVPEGVVNTGADPGVDTNRPR